MPAGRSALLSRGHALAFRQTGYVMTNGRYALTVDFEGASPTLPSSNAVDSPMDAPADASAGAPAAAPAADLGRVTYDGLYPGIRLDYDVPAGGIARSTWTLAPGADAGAIRLGYNRPVVLDRPDGALTIAFEKGTLTESAPVAWQEIGGRRVPVAVAYRRLGERELGFALGKYDRALPLIIDPVLEWHTFMGGSGSEALVGVAVDGSGNVYMAGLSSSSWGMPVEAYTSLDDAIAVKLDGSGNILWNTFLGGVDIDSAVGVALDGAPEPNVFTVGFSSATWGSPLEGFTSAADGFVAKLGPSRVLGVSLLGPGTGSVSSSPAGIACLSDCEEEFALGSVVTLTATADPGSIFAGWIGDPDCADGTITVDDDLACVATFEFAPPPTAAKVVGLSAWVNASGRTVIAWETASEVDVLGFRVERAETASGPFTPISPTILAEGNAGAGARYRLVDTASAATHYYRLVMVNAGGRAEIFGPVVARVLGLRVFLPVLLGRSGNGCING